MSSDTFDNPEDLTNAFTSAFQTSRTNAPLRPPSSYPERQHFKFLQRNANNVDNYVSQIKRSFTLSDSSHSGQLTFDQWKNSTLRWTAFDGNLTFEEFIQIFYRIDAEERGFVTWNELVHFLLNYFSTDDPFSASSKLQNVKKQRPNPSVFSHAHNEPIQQIFISSFTQEYITFSSDSIRFWKVSPLEYARTLPLKGPFSACFPFSKIPFLVLITMTRKMFFFSMDKLMKIPCEISASPSEMALKQMGAVDSQKFLRSLQNKTNPLFNIPTAIIEAHSSFTPSRKLETKFFVGDECGNIEFYVFTTPKNGDKNDYRIERLCLKQIHDGSITQMSVITSLSKYASSSVDGTVKFFSVNQSNFPTISVQITHVFNEGSQIFNFSYLPFCNSLLICSFGKDAHIWSCDPVQRQASLETSASSPNNSTLFTSYSGDTFIVTMNNKKELFFWDSQNNGFHSSYFDSDFIPPKNNYSALTFDSQRNVLLTGSTYPIQWIEEFQETNNNVTHLFPIVGLFYTSTFNEIISIDTKGTLIVNDPNTGKRLSCKNLKSSNFNCAALDAGGRILYAVTFSGDIKILNYSSAQEINHFTPSNDIISSQNSFSMITQSSFKKQPSYQNINSNSRTRTRSRSIMSKSSTNSPLTSTSNLTFSNAGAGLISNSPSRGKILPSASGGIDQSILAQNPLKPSNLTYFSNSSCSNLISNPISNPISSSISNNLSFNQNNSQSSKNEMINVLYTFSHLGQSMLACGCANSIHIYVENKNKMELVKYFQGHTADISSAIYFEKGYLITGSIIGELFIWNLDGSHSTFFTSTQTPNSEPIEQFAIFDEKLFVGGSEGSLFVFEIPRLNLLSQIKDFSDNNCAISAISVIEPDILITGDSHGEIQKWFLPKVGKNFIKTPFKHKNLLNLSKMKDNSIVMNINNVENIDHSKINPGISNYNSMPIMKTLNSPDLQFENQYKPEIRIRRFGHKSEVIKIVPLENGHFFATASKEEEITLWETENFRKIGVFTNSSSWSLFNSSTWEEPEKRNTSNEKSSSFIKPSETSPLLESLQKKAELIPKLSEKQETNQSKLIFPNTEFNSKEPQKESNLKNEENIDEILQRPFDWNEAASVMKQFSLLNNNNTNNTNQRVSNQNFQLKQTLQASNKPPDYLKKDPIDISNMYLHLQRIKKNQKARHLSSAESDVKDIKSDPK